MPAPPKIGKCVRGLAVAARASWGRAFMGLPVRDLGGGPGERDERYER